MASNMDTVGTFEMAAVLAEVSVIVELGFNVLLKYSVNIAISLARRTLILYGIIHYP